VGVVVWDAATGKQTHRLEAPPRTCAVGFTADGTLLLTGAKNELYDRVPPNAVRRPDTAVRFWDLAAGKEVRQLETGAEVRTQFRWTGTAVRGLVQSPDRKLLAVLCDVTEIHYRPAGAPGPKPQPYTHGQVRVFELATGTELLRAAVERESGVAFSPDGRRLAWGRYSGVSLWDRDTGKLSWSVGRNWGVRALQFTPDSGSLATGSVAGWVLLWDLARVRRGEHPDVEHERRLRPPVR
jgi:WD40 repeat protein